MTLDPIPQPPIPKPVAVIRLHFHSPEGKWTNILYATITGIVSGYEDLLAIANGVSTALAGKLKQCLSGQVTYEGLYIRYTTSTLDLEAYSGAGEGEGDLDGDAMPLQDVFEIRKLTSKPGRSKRGRVFFSGMSEEQVENGEISVAMAPDLLALSAQLATSVVIGDRTVNWRHWDRKNNVLEVITQCAVIKRLVSRRDRAKHEAYVPLFTA